MAFTNKTFLITGANSGMGYDVAKNLSEQGAKVYITGRNAAAIYKVAKELGANVVGVVAEASSIPDSELLRDLVMRNGDSLDGLFINAGIGKMVPFELVDEATYDLVMNINAKGPFFTIQKLLPVMKDGSSIVLNSSGVVYSGHPTSTVYTASKCALNSLAKTLSRDLLPRRIRVNCVNPGPIETPFFGKSDLPSEVVDGLIKTMATTLPAGRIGRVSDITGYVLFLLSDASTFILGTDLAIDGGMSTL